MTLPPDYVEQWLKINEAQKNKNALERIRELHKEFYDWCIICRDPQNPEHNAQFPCDMRKIADGIELKQTLDASETLQFDFDD